MAMRVGILKRSALIVVDVQNDFMPGGSLPVPDGDKVVQPLNKVIKEFQVRKLPMFFTRDWHPPNHMSFKERGGPWPPHCVQGTEGAEFHPDLLVPEEAIIISKATEPDKEAYSGFEGTELKRMLREREVRRLFIGGVATDYCVRATVLDGLRLGFEVIVLEDAVRGVAKETTEKALREIVLSGAILARTDELLFE